MANDKVIGIDLGTTYSCVAVVEGGRPVIIENAEGARTTPSVVAFMPNGERLIGQVAKRQAVTNPQHTVASIKRQMGTNDRIPIGDTSYSPEQISAIILQKLKADAEAHMGEKISKAVITVPAYFNDAQRKATRDAGQIAGLEVLRIINEPTASSLAYGLDKAHENQVILVFDLGGGTFDVSILEITDGVFEVKATSGNNHLGGDDFDACLMSWMLEEFHKAHGIDISRDVMAVSRLKEAAEKSKIELSSAMSSEIHLPFLAADASGPKHLQLTLSRTKFNELTHHLVEATLGPVEAALSDANLGPEQIDQVLLVGGSTRIPAIQDGIKFKLGKEPSKQINPDEAVALGAAIQASIISGDVVDILLLDVIPLSLGIETAGGLFTRIIERNTTIPTSRTMTFTTTDDGQTTVEVHVLQGEREVAKFNQSLAKFFLTDIHRAPRGVPQIDVTFEVNADGILQCRARDAATGSTQTVTVSRTTGLAPDEVARLQKEAEEFAEQDQELKERISTKIKAETLVLEADRSIQKYGTSVDSELIERVQQALASIKQSLKEDGDQSTLKSLVAGLDVALLELGRALYAHSRHRAGASAEISEEDREALHDHLDEEIHSHHGHHHEEVQVIAIDDSEEVLSE